MAWRRAGTGHQLITHFPSQPDCPGSAEQDVGAAGELSRRMAGAQFVCDGTRQRPAEKSSRQAVMVPQHERRADILQMPGSTGFHGLDITIQD